MEPTPQEGPPVERRRSIDKAVADLADTISTLTQTAASIGEDVTAINAKSERDALLVDQLKTQTQRDHRLFGQIRFILIVLAVGMCLWVATSIGQYRATVSAKSAANAIRDCTVATGACAQRSNAIQQQLILSIAYVGDARRLQTEVQVAQATNQTAAVAIRSAQLAEDQRVLGLISQNIDDVDHNRAPRNVVTFPVVNTTTTVR